VSSHTRTSQPDSASNQLDTNSETRVRLSAKAKPLQFERLLPEEMAMRGKTYADAMSKRRSVRAFSSEPFPFSLVEDAVRAAATAPSGAHQQPWTFVAVTDAELKKRIRTAAEEEEFKNWHGRMPEEWLTALQPLGVDWMKPHLTDAPVLMVVFAQSWGEPQTGSAGKVRTKHYYVDESVGIAVGLLLSALHLSGLATLTHTPSPMRFLRQVLGRPDNERPYVVIPIGYPAADATVPDVARKSLDQVLVRR
jgi:iodotyrosine deiodinase